MTTAAETLVTTARRCWPNLTGYITPGIEIGLTFGERTVGMGAEDAERVAAWLTEAARTLRGTAS